MNTQKKTYEKPFVEVFKAEVCSHLLDWSAPKDDGPGTGTVEIESKGFDSSAEWGKYEPKEFDFSAEWEKYGSNWE